MTTDRAGRIVQAITARTNALITRATRGHFRGPNGSPYRVR